jgi:signal transduction histidine kinase/CheY-like chemotaxis protein
MRQRSSLPGKLHIDTALTLLVGGFLAWWSGAFAWSSTELLLLLFLLLWGALASFDHRPEARVRELRLVLGPGAICLAQILATQLGVGSRAALVVATASTLADSLLNREGRSERELGDAPRGYAAAFHLGNAWIAVSLAGLVYGLVARLTAELPHLAMQAIAGGAWLAVCLLVFTLGEAFASAFARDYTLDRAWRQSLSRWAPSFVAGLVLSLASLALVMWLGRLLAFGILVLLFLIHFTSRFYIEKDQASRQFQSVLAGARDGVAILREYTIVYANEAFAQILKRPLAEILNTDYPRYLPPHAIGWTDLRALSEAGVAEMELRRPDNTLVRVEVAISPVLFNGRACLQLVARDVTARYALQRQAAQTQKLQALGQMAAGVAHDFNNALMAIVGNLSVARAVLSRPFPPPEAIEMAGNRLRMAEKSAMDAATTVRRLQVYSRPAPDVIEIVDLADLIREVRLILRPLWHDASRAEGKEISVEVSGEPPVPVEASPAELREALTNLVTNAVHAMPKGGSIRLTATVDEREAEAVVTVADTGTGMPQEVLDHIFEPFFTTKGKLGTGLGLFVTAGIINHHGGRVEVKSAPAQGTTFTLHFPVAEEKNADEAVELPQIPANLRALFVEDDEMVRDATAGMLESAGVTVEAVSSGAAALEALGAGEFDLVVTDMAMPGGMTGIDLAREVRTRHPNLPIILFSGYLGQAKQDGVDETEGLIAATLSKPLTLPSLLQAICTAVDSAEPSPAKA